MELLDTSMANVSDIVYNKLNQRIPENILGKMTVAVIKALHFLQKELKIIHRGIVYFKFQINCLFYRYKTKQHLVKQSWPFQTL